MVNTPFFDVVNQVAQAAMSGSALPSMRGKLLAHLKIIAKFFEGDDIVTVDENSAKLVILGKTSAQNDAALIDTTAVFSGSGDTAQYVFEWPLADSVQLRAVLDAAADPTQPLELRYQLLYAIGGVEGTIGGPILFENNFFRPETPTPEATLDSSWTTLKARVLAGSNLTRTVDDNAKTMTFAGEDSEANAAAIAAEATARAAADTTLQTNITSEAAARAAADTTNANAIASEATTRAAADTTNATAIAAETASRQAADTTLQSNINSEAAARAAADTTNANAIASEATTRAAADTTLQSNITSEATARAAADTTNANAIAAETTARTAADTTLQNNIDSKQPLRTELTRYFGAYVDLTAATTTDIGAVNSDYVRVNGNTTISAFGTAAAGVRRFLRFTGTPILQASSAIILPRTTNLTAGIGDFAEFVSDGGNVWRCVSYLPIEDYQRYRRELKLAFTMPEHLASDQVSASQNYDNDCFIITGSSNITALPSSLSLGTERTLIFTTSLLLVQNGSSLLLPGENNITTASGDVARFRHVASGVWRCMSYLRGNGDAVIPQSAIYRSTGQLKGFTDGGSPASAPADLILSFSGDYTNVQGDQNLYFNGQSTKFYLAPSDPSDPFWIDTTVYLTAADVASRVAELFNSVSGITGVAATAEGADVRLVNSITGSSANSSSSSGNASISGLTTSGGGAGTNETPPSGEVTKVELAPVVASRRIYAIRFFVIGESANVLSTPIRVGFDLGSDSYYDLTPEVTVTDEVTELKPTTAEQLSYWFTGQYALPLVARIIGSTPDGGVATVCAIVEYRP